MDLERLATGDDRQAALSGWGATGLAVMRGVLDESSVSQLIDWTQDLEHMSQGPAGPMHHFEQTGSSAVITRSERFADVHEELGRFVRNDVAELIEVVAHERVALFKEKINYKYPGGAGFAPHQDARAYRFANWHVSVMVPLDPATVSSGCLWFADNPGRELLETDGRGRIADHVAARLRWYPVPVEPGDVVVFDSRGSALQ